MFFEQFIHQFRISFQPEPLNRLFPDAKIGKMTMEPYAHAHSCIHITGHCEQTGQDACQKIAGTGLSKCLIAGLVDIELSVGEGNDGIRPFENNDYLIIPCKCPIDPKIAWPNAILYFAFAGCRGFATSRIICADSPRTHSGVITTFLIDRSEGI